MFFAHRGTAIFIRNDVFFTRLWNYEKYSFASFSTMCFKLKIGNSRTFFCFIYRSPSLSSDQTGTKLDILSDTLSKIRDKSPLAEIVVAGDFNVHNPNWLTYSGEQYSSGLYTVLFCYYNLLTQILLEPTHLPRITNHRSNLLDLFLTSQPSKYEVTVIAAIGSDHNLIKPVFPALIQSHQH